MIINILETIFWWLLGTIGVALIIYLGYLFLYWQAKQVAQKNLADEYLKMANERLEFNKEKASLDKRELGFQKQTGEVMESFFKKRDELKIQIQNVEEELITAQKIKEEAQLKVDHILRENIRLRNDVIAARQRAKRFAKKIKTEV